MSKKNINLFIVLDAGGFPIKISAAGNKYFLMGKALKKESFEVLLLNLINTTNDLTSDAGEVEGIRYEFLSGLKKQQTFLEKLFGFIKGQFNLLKKFSVIKKTHSGFYVSISYCPFILVIYYRLLSKIFNFKLIINIMEFHPSIAKTYREKINAHLFDYYSFYFADAALPISEFLKTHLESNFKNLPVLKIPALADFTYMDTLRTENHQFEENYFLYCGSIGYVEVVELIIDSFNMLNQNNYKLYLVLSGKNDEVTKFSNSVSNNSKITIFSQLEYIELLQLYDKSKALLVPMRNNLQDRARFPQKVPEYLSTGVPVITNRVGELKHYFIDRENIVFADNYSVSGLSTMMKFIIDNPQESKRIGENGKTFGKRLFHYENISNSLSTFLKDI